MKYKTTSDFFPATKGPPDPKLPPSDSYTNGSQWRLENVTLQNVAGTDYAASQCLIVWTWSCS